jgi:amino-acid N-acetyltransferase
VGLRTVKTVENVHKRGVNLSPNMRNDIRIEAFKREDKKEVLKLLSQAELPIKDLVDDKFKNFLIARAKDGSVIGAIGVESYQDVGLLRSLVVHPFHRGSGLGKRLVYELESFAQNRGIKTIFLLTITAADFFLKLGYEVTQRAHVPASIARTEEFKNICPVSAVCLFKNLEPT